MSSSLAGAPPKHARAFLDRQRPILAARWVRSCRRALRYLNDPANPVNGDWIRLFNSLGDRLGYARVTEQKVDSTAITADLGSETVRVFMQAAAVQVEAIRKGEKDKNAIH